MNGFKVNKYILCVALVFIAALAYKLSDGSMRTVSAIMATLASLVAWFNLGKEKKQSGLSDDDFAIKKAGSVEALIEQAQLMRGIGWLFIIIPTGITLFLWLTMRNHHSTALVIGVAILGLCLPLVVVCFWSASKNQGIAQRAKKISYK